MAETALVTKKEILERKRSEWIEQLGTRDELMKALDSSQSPKAQRFLELLAMPKNSRTGMAKIAQQAGLSMMDFAQIFRNWYSSQALMKFYKELPNLSADIAADARAYKDFCSTCGGKGAVVLDPDDPRAGKSKCVRCEGTGVIQKPGDTEARKYMGEATGQIKSRQGVNVNVNVANVGIDSFVEDLERDSSPVIDISPQNE